MTREKSTEDLAKLAAAKALTALIIKWAAILILGGGTLIAAATSFARVEAKADQACAASLKATSDINDIKPCLSRLTEIAEQLKARADKGDGRLDSVDARFRDHVERAK
jgi:hypothetical protein